MTYLAAVDIGGTKCAVSLGEWNADGLQIRDKVAFPTPSDPFDAISAMSDALQRLIEASGLEPAAIGISCGGPLNSRTGLVLSPPNLRNWDRIDVVTPFRERFGVPVGLQNDANACALAEWRWGAGAGCDNMIFLTFGTGMGSGLVLNGKLYSGTNDMAGEVGHMRIEDEGPIGYNKAGSFEGFCSGGGIAKIGQRMALEALQAGEAPAFCPAVADLPGVTAHTIGIAARDGDPLALRIYEQVGVRLGQGLGMLIDVLNPQRIVIGSIFGRQRELLEPPMYATLRREALSYALDVCEIVPAGLGEQVGDYAGFSVAADLLPA